jgi:Spy/CpxP family protein refolding chaperone
MGDRDAVFELLRPEVRKELAITADQAKKLEDIRFDGEKESIQHRAALHIQRMELSRLINSENPDRTAIDKKIQEIAQEEASVMRSTVNADLNARAVLTAEQRGKLALVRQDHARMERMPVEGGVPAGHGGPRAGQARDKAPQPSAPARPWTE